MKKTILKNIIPIVIVFIGLGVGLSVHYTQASTTIKDAYTTSSTISCTWSLWGVVCDNVDVDGNWAGSVYSQKGDCSNCPKANYDTCHHDHLIYKNSCGGEWCTTKVLFFKLHKDGYSLSLY